jgi:small subunit ribosomal protein S7
MSRKGSTERRPVTPDPIFQSELVSRFINSLMLEGKKSCAQAIFYDAMAIIENRAQKSGMTDADAAHKGHHEDLKEMRAAYAMLKKAVDIVSPAVEVRSRRVGGATYQVPVEVPPRRRNALAIRWLINAARSRREKGMVQRLANEIMDACSEKGGAYDMMVRVIKMAKANQAFAHYRWW